MTSPEFRILIAGGGIAGSCLAYWLSRSKLNAKITIIERSPTPRVTGQAVDIRGHAVEVITLMGLKDEILASNTTETGTVFIDSKERIVAQFDADGSNNTSTSEYEILRADLAEIFLKATKSRKNVEFVYGESIDTLSQTESDVTVSFKYGRKPETFDLVVGADGLRSKTRRVAFDPAIGANPYHSLGLYAAYFSIPRREGDTRLWYWYNATRGRVLMLRPHKNPKTMGAYLCITMPDQKKKDPVIEKAMAGGNDEVKKLLREEFKDAGWQAERILEGMETATDFYATTWDQVRMPKWIEGRVALIGDSAMATPGIGTSYAIGGAYVLAGELSKLSSPAEIPAALEEFQKNLRPHIDQRVVGGVFQLMNPQSAWALSIRNALLWMFWMSGAQKLFWLFTLWDSKPPEMPKYEWARE